jgi:hypothetical protein
MRKTPNKLTECTSFSLDARTGGDEGEEAASPVADDETAILESVYIRQDGSKGMLRL